MGKFISFLKYWVIKWIYWIRNSVASTSLISQHHPRGWNFGSQHIWHSYTWFSHTLLCVCVHALVLQRTEPKAFPLSYVPAFFIFLRQGHLYCPGWVQTQGPSASASQCAHKPLGGNWGKGWLGSPGLPTLPHKSPPLEKGSTGVQGGFTKNCHTTPTSVSTGRVVMATGNPFNPFSQKVTPLCHFSCLALQTCLS